MAQDWQIEGPRILDIGGEGEAVRRLKVGLVAGRVDIVTHDDSPTARLEVHSVAGKPLLVSWDGSTLRISHVKDKEGNLWESLKRFSKEHERLNARVSLSVPTGTDVAVSTVSAAARVTGVHAGVKANTVSGEVECHQLEGDFKGNSVSGPLTVQASRLEQIKLNSVSGDITLDLLKGTARINSTSVSGDVTVRIPAGGGYAVNAHTASGHVVIDGRSMTGPAGKRGGQVSDGDQALVVKANSVSGNVVVLRAQPIQDTIPTQQSAG
jgi:DUF4097 and DUF4098 domain-containing protein YvlB